MKYKINHNIKMHDSKVSGMGHWGWGGGKKHQCFFDEVVSKLIRFGLVSLLNLGPTCGAGKVLFRISLRLYAFC